MHLLIDTLNKGLKKDLKDSDFAKNLYKHLKTGKTPINIVEIKTFASLPSKSEFTETDDNLDKNKDYRLRRLLLKGIRKFPCKKDTFYSISFSDFGECKSTVFLGSNGVGKSSLFNALEMIGAGYMASAELRGYQTTEQQIKYLRHADVPDEDTAIVIETYNENFRFQIGEQFNPLAFPAFFCMENDVLQISKQISSDYIARQLGVSDYHQILTIIDTHLKSRNKLTLSYESNIKRLSLLNFNRPILNALTLLDSSNKRILYSTLTIKNIDMDDANHLPHLHRYLYRHIRKAISILSSQDKTGYFLKSFTSEMNTSPEIFQTNYVGINLEDKSAKETCSEWIEIISKLKGTIDKAGGIDIKSGNITNRTKLTEDIVASDVEIEKLEKAIHDQENESPLVSLTKQQLSDLVKTNQYLRLKYGKIIKEVVFNANSAFRYLMQPYYGNDIKGVNIIESGGGMNIEINLEGCLPNSGISLGSMPPQRYLNTFRFKIFCVSLKISLAFACKKFHHINFPIVIDDVFDSSDFSNRERIQDFTKNLWRCHKSIFKEENSLQLIFFTQDDVISESVYRGIQESENEERVKHARIYNYYEAEETDIHKEFIDKTLCEIIKLEDPL